MLKSYIENETLKAENTRKEKKVSKNFSVLIAYLYVYAKRTKNFSRFQFSLSAIILKVVENG